MTITDQVHALELERDSLHAQLAAATSALDAMRERGATAGDYWRSRAERAEARVALLEAYERLQAYSNEPPANLGEWHVWFSYGGNDGAGLNFSNRSLPMAVAGIVQGWFERPQELEMRISKPKPAAALVRQEPT